MQNNLIRHCEGALVLCPKRRRGDTIPSLVWRLLRREVRPPRNDETIKLPSNPSNLIDSQSVRYIHLLHK